MVEKRSFKFASLKNQKVKLSIAIIILLSSFMAVASPGDSPPNADCGPDKLNCQNINTPVQFNASVSYDSNGSIISYEWDFGDGTTGTGVAPNHTYTSYRWNGSAYLPFIVHLNVTNDLGESNITYQQVTIWIAGDANGDGVVNILDASVVGLKWNTNDECADLNNDGSVNILDASIIGLNWARRTSDNTPPASVTKLISVSFAENYINWSWKDPADTDFASVSVWIDGEFKSSVPKGKQSYEATGFASDSDHNISTKTTDTSGNLNHTWVNHTARTTVAIELPPDPVTVAPPVDTTVATTIAASTSFLYTGSNPIQTGVANGTIEARRAAVLRGRVLTREGTNLSGVNITILSHPEFGSTLSRADGIFDMAVNGGGLLTVNYEKQGYLPAQRQVNVPWQDFAWLPDIVMIQADPKVTSINLSSSESIQVAQGSVENDTRGTRQATLLFPQGVQGNITLPDGTKQTLTSMNVHVTEYTVGENGPEAMPAELPPQIGYTYAVEFSVDEAPGANEIRFSQPIPFYVENFLNFYIGTTVPLGYYNRSLGLWIPSDNGIVIKVLNITGGMAQLDIDGSNKSANASQLASLNITDEELQKLANLYQPNQSLWRMTINHFSSWDANQGTRCKDNECEFPNQPEPYDPDVDNPNCTPGSIISCENQALGEAVGITGTPFSMHYQSDRVPGQKVGKSLDIQLTGATVPPKLISIKLEISVAGRLFTEYFPITPNQKYTFVWDGKGAYNRTLQGRQRVKGRIGYAYEMEYTYTGRFGYNGNGGITISCLGCPGPQDMYLWQDFQSSIGSWDAPSQGLGGWSLNVHHAYDTSGSVLYLGDGRKLSAQSLSLNGVITTVAGNGTPGFSGDGGPAVKARLNIPQGVTIGADGSIYIADTDNVRVRRVGPDGNITTVAGTGILGYSGDGGPATQARLFIPRGVTMGADGSLYIADHGNNRIRRVGPDGIITTVAGSGGICDPWTICSNGDGGSATQAKFAHPTGVAIGSDGSLYITDLQNYRVRRVGPDGIITTVAGNGTYGFSGDGGPATQAQLYGSLKDVAIGSDGSLYFIDGGTHVHRVGSDGIITTVAGNQAASFSGDGGPAKQAGLQYASGLAIGSDGSLFISQYYVGVIRHVGTDGIITKVAGTGFINGAMGFSGDGGPATQARFARPEGVAIGADGSLYIADSENNRIRRVAPTLPGLSITNLLISSEDASELYIFNSAGRHLRTLEALTGAVRYNFTYDSEGRLNAVTDGDGNMVTIERDTSGNPLAIVSPYGQRTDLTLDANGYLDSITNPKGDSIQLAYTSDGLLTSMTDPRGSTYTYNYDALGRLIKDEDPAGGFKALERTDIDKGYSVKLSTGLNRSTTYQVEKLSITTQEGTLYPGDIKRTNIFPWGLKTETITGTDGSETSNYPDGTNISLLKGPDPRFGMQAPVTKIMNVTTPGGLKGSIISDGRAVLTNPNDLQSLKTLTRTTSINGRTFTSTFDAASLNITSLTPLGRKSITILDSKGRVAQGQVPGIIPVNFTYDTRGRLSDIVQGTRAYALRYDTQGNLANVTDPLSRTAGFEYDTAGRITKQTLPDGRQIGYAYDANGNVLAITPPGRPDHAFNYTPVDLMKDYMPPDIGIGATSTRYSYNIDRQLTSVMRPDGVAIELGYDSAGRPSTIKYPQGTTTMAYDPVKGNLKEITAPDGGKITYAYDGSLLTDTTWSGAISGSIHRTYDNNFSITSESVNGGNIVSFQYDSDGLLTRAGSLNLIRDAANGMLTGSTLGNITDSLGYSSFGEVVAYQASSSGSGIFSVNYTRDELGRIVKKNESIDGATHTYNYMYDTAGRLVNVSKDGVRISEYVYDANGNRLSYTGSGGTINGTYDDQDRLLQYGTTNYTYTANGELLSKTNGSQTTTYQYDVMGNLRNVTLPDGTKIEYIIDGQNRRIGKKVNGAMVQGFLYRDGLRPVAELDGSGNVVSRFVPGYMVKGGNTYRILTDHLGSPRMVIDVTTGSVAQWMDYDEFGNVILDSNPGFQPFGFASGLYDQDLKLVRFGARDYYPKTGRWTAKDPLGFRGGSANLFSYVANNPLSYVDPNGIFAIALNFEIDIIIPFLSGGGGSAGVSIVLYSSSGGEGLYFYIPTNEGSEGFSVGASAQLCVAAGSGPWSGKFDNAGGGLGSGTGGWFMSVTAPGEDPGYSGFWVGGSLGAPVGAAYSQTDYIPLSVTNPRSDYIITDEEPTIRPASERPP